MRKRLRIRRFTGGASSKFLMTDIMEGATAETLAVTEPMVSWVHGQFSDINDDPYQLYSNDQLLYRYEWFEKQYYPNNPDLSGVFVTNGVDLQVRPDTAEPIDMVQFGDYVFALTDLATKNISSATTTWPTPSNWTEENTSVVTYIPIASLSAGISGGHQVLIDIRTMTSIPSADWPTSGSLVDLTLSGLDFNIVDGVYDEVYGEDDPISGHVVYVKSLDPNNEYYNVCYGSAAGFQKIPSNFLLETPLAALVRFNSNNEVFGDDINGVSGVYSTGDMLSGQEIVYGPSSGINKIYVNPLQLKNIYNPNYNLSTMSGREALAGIRKYIRVGKAQTLGWLCYKYFDDECSPMAEYDMIERVKGLYKFRFPHLHKSNIFSVRLKNSGLNNIIRDEAGTSFKDYIKPIIEGAVKDVVKKLAPAGTQFWRIIWEGK